MNGISASIKEAPEDPSPFHLVRIQQEGLTVPSLEQGLHHTPSLPATVTLAFQSPDRETSTSVVRGILS